MSCIICKEREGEERFVHGLKTAPFCDECFNTWKPMLKLLAAPARYVAYLPQVRDQVPLGSGRTITVDLHGD